MNRFGSLLRALGLAASLTTLVGCQAIFGDFTIDDSAFPDEVVQTGPIRLMPTKGLYTTEWGGQATFTIVLDYAPTSDVTVALSSSNPNEGKPTPTSVTFTKDDWRAPQVITVTGVDDVDADTNQTYKIITAPAVSEDKAFNGKNPSDVELVNIDNETAGITVVPMAGLVTSEGGGQDTFTVVLNSEPEKDVTVNLVSDTPTEGTVSPESLVFTPLNWKAPQLATVTGIHDGVKDPAHAYKITVTSASEDQNYARVVPVTVAVTNQDSDSAGLSIALVSGIDPIDPTKLRTSESGDSATFTVALTVAPIADVTIAVSSNAPNEGEVSPVVLRFTPLNWNAPQTLTVMGRDDDGTADGDQPYMVVLGVLASEDADYAVLPEVDVPVSNVDNEKPGFTLMLLSGIDPKDPSKLLTTEAGTTASFSLALNSRPSAPVTIPIVSSLISEGKVTPSSLVFTTLNWQSPQTVSVTGVNDDIQDGSPIFYIRTGEAMSEDLSYVLDPQDVQVTNQDDDSAGVRVTLVKGIDPTNPNRLVTDEYGTTATFTVALTSEPQNDVSISLSSSNEKEGIVSPTTLTFTKVNYRAPQSVNVTGQNDDVIVDGNQPFVINVEAAISDDQSFNGKFASQVSVTNRDDDSADVIVTPTSDLTTSESGKTATFAIRLQSKPSDKVTINIRSSNTAEGQPSVDSVIFTPANWNANQTVTVTGVDDDDPVQDGNATYKITFDPAQSNDPNYRGKDPSDLTLTNIDNDSAGIIVSPTSGLVTNEDKLKATFTIVLASKPVGSTGVSVKIQLSSNRPTEGTVMPSTVTFDALNWKSPQTVTVTGVNDDLADGDQPYMIVTSAASSVDGNYNNRKPADVSVTNRDNDIAGLKIMPLPSTAPTLTTEKPGSKPTFSVALNSQPTGDVMFSVTSLDTSEGTVSPGTLKFTTGNWNTAQVVTVTGVDDDQFDGNQQYSVRLSDASSTDPGYNGKFGTDLPFVNVDDDHSGIDIVALPNLTTSELNAGTATFTVALLSQPSSGVSIGVSSSNTAEGTVSPPTLSFTTGNWSKPQTVTITGVQDDVADGPQAYQVKVANAVSADGAYSGQFGTQLDVQNLDDDQPGYSVDAGPSLQTTEKGGQATFSVILKSKPAGATTVTLGVSSSDTKEGTVSPSSLVFTGANWDQAHVVTVTGVDDKKIDGDAGYQVVFAADTNYGGPAPAPVALTNIDNGLGVLVAPTTCATITGTTTTFTINLNSAPSAGVTISLTSDTPTMGTVSPESVTFTPSGVGSWDTPQTVTVTGVSDGAYKIITSDASAPGETTGYNGFTNIADVSCTNTTNPP